MAEQGSKSGRRERHQAAERARKENKKLRQRKAEVHRAMIQAMQMKRSKKKGCADFEENMRTLGYEPKEKTTGVGTLVGRDIPGDVLAKYEAIS